MSKISNRRKSARKLGGLEYEKKRKEILHVAASVFREFGFEKATVDEIAQRTNLDRASLYYYFKGKRELFREMVGSATFSNVEIAETIAAGDAGPASKLRQLITEIFDSYERHYPYLFVYLQEDMNRLTVDDSEWSEKILELNRRFDLAVTGIVSDGIESGVFQSKGGPKLIMAALIGMCNWSHRWFRVDGPMRGTEIADIFCDMVLNGLLTPQDRQAT